MSSLAAISFKQGYIVTGSDRSDSPVTQRLRESGIDIHIGHNALNIQDCDAVIYTAAIAADNVELEEAHKKSILCITRAVYLGWLMRGYKNRIGIAGTHGKSSTTSMTAAIMLESGMDPTVISGAEFKGMQEKGQVSGAYRSGGRDNFIFEACEYTDSFLSFYPTTAVVTNVELDHVDYFHDLGQYIRSFSEYISIAGKAVVNFDNANARIASESFEGELIGFSAVSDDAVYRAKSIRYMNGCAHFTLTAYGKTICEVNLSVPGEFNVYNALAAAAASLENGASADAVQKGLASFGGAHRRFEFKGMFNGAFIYDDYAHHPTEIRSTLSAARSIAGHRRILCVFQPHSLSRTTGLFKNFTEAFADADIIVFADTYENLEKDCGQIKVSSADLSSRVNASVYMRDFGEIISFLKKEAHDGDMIIIMGAGNIFKLSEILTQKQL